MHTVSCSRFSHIFLNHTGSLRLRLPLLRACPESSVPATTTTTAAAAAAAATLSSEAHPEPSGARSDPTVLKVSSAFFFVGK